MLQVSDEIQSLAQSFGERIALQAALKVLTSHTHAPTKEVLHKIIRLHCISLIKKDISFYLVNNLISSAAALDLESSYQSAVKGLVPHINDILEGFNLPQIPQLWGPIARDYQKFNS